MKIGDLVKMKHIASWRSANSCRRRIGIALEWYDSPKGVVTVAWCHKGKIIETNPYPISILEVISESR